MPKIIVCVAGALGAAAVACASAPEARSVAAASGCSQLGGTSQTVAAILSPGSIYDARKAEPSWELSATGLDPGTKLYVHAPAGISKEYLTRALVCHAAYGPQLSPRDPLHPESGRVVSIDVRSDGPGYEISVAGENRKTNAEIWRRAHDLARSSVAQPLTLSEPDLSR